MLEHLDKKAIDTFYNQNILGLNVTVPHKIDIMHHIHDINQDAKNIGSVNTLVYTKKGYIGYNTDINGIEDTFYENNVDIKNKNMLILGAGGSGYTATYVGAKGKANVIVANRTRQKALDLKRHIKNVLNTDISVVDIEDINVLKDIDIVVNTTTVGFSKNQDKSILEQDFFNKNKTSFVLDIIYNPFETKLLKIAKENNIKIANGFSMLIYQALKSQEIWQNINIPISYKINFKNKILGYINH